MFVQKSYVHPLCNTVLTFNANQHKLITEALAERTGRPKDDLAVRTTAGAILGVSIAALAAVVEAQELDLDTYLRRIDEGLAQLEKGLAL